MHRGASAKLLGVDAVEDDIDLGLVLVRKQVALELRRAVAGTAGLEVQQDHRVPRPGPEEVARLGGEVRPEVHVRTVWPVIIFKIIDDWHAGIQLGQEGCRAEPAMADDQIGRQVGVRRARLIDGVGVPDRVLERSAEVVRRGACTAAGLVLDLAYAVPDSAGGLRNEVALPALRPDQVACDVPELCRKVLMDEQDPHRSARTPQGPSDRGELSRRSSCGPSRFTS